MIERKKGKREIKRRNQKIERKKSGREVTKKTKRKLPHNNVFKSLQF